GDLDNVKRVVKLNAFVNSDPAFTDQPTVVNGASDTMVEVFGDAGKHARSAVGVASLPLGVPVEIDGICAVAYRPAPAADPPPSFPRSGNPVSCATASNPATEPAAPWTPACAGVTNGWKAPCPKPSFPRKWESISHAALWIVASDQN